MKGAIEWVILNNRRSEQAPSMIKENASRERPWTIVPLLARDSTALRIIFSPMLFKVSRKRILPSFSFKKKDFESLFFVRWNRNFFSFEIHRSININIFTRERLIWSNLIFASYSFIFPTRNGGDKFVCKNCHVLETLYTYSSSRRRN